MAFKQRCYPLKPRLVTIFIGITTLVIWLIILFGGVYLYCEAKESVKKSEKMDSVPGTIILSSGAAFLSLILMCSGGVGLIPTALLIFGSVKEWKYFLLPWLVVSMMGMVFIVVCLGVNFREFAANPVLLVWFPCLALCIYLWTYVWVYYKSFSQRRDDREELGNLHSKGEELL